jgi:pSer/pThr/pTyr-binding forkhead associated (FHA) protein
MPAASQQNHFLIIHDDRGDETVPLVESKYSIGRDRSCDIRLISQFVSRHHATLQRYSNEDGTFYYQIIDGDFEGRRSANGLLIHSRKLRTHNLENKDQVIFGPQVWMVYHQLKRDHHTTHSREEDDDFDITLINPGSIGFPEDITDANENSPSGEVADGKAADSDKADSDEGFDKSTEF